MESIDHALDTYCRHVMTEMGTDTTSTSALDHYGRTHFPGGFFAGVHRADREPPPPTGTDFYIQNTEPASHPRIHWVAIARVPGYPDLLFDSFARKAWCTSLLTQDCMQIVEIDLADRPSTRRARGPRAASRSTDRAYQRVPARRLAEANDRLVEKQ